MRSFDSYMYNRDHFATNILANLKPKEAYGHMFGIKHDGLYDSVGFRLSHGSLLISAAKEL